jgi:transposase-like protein
MTKKNRKRLPEDVKAKAVADYVSGAKTATEIAKELGVDVQNIYQWRSAQNEKTRDFNIAGFMAEGVPPEVAKRLIQQQEEIEAYQKKVAEQAVMIDLLKKLRLSKNFQPESELSGLIATTKKLDRNKGRA